MTQGSRRPARPARDDSWSARVRRLEAEVEGLRRAIRTRGLIEQAKGRLVERLGLDPDEAFRYLSRRSQDTNVAVAEVAAELMGAEASVGVDETVYQRRVVRLRAGIDAAAEPAQLLEAVADVDWLAASAVALFAVEADGALRLLAATGWPARTVSDWRWIPSVIRTPAAEAVRRCEPLWLDKPDGLTLVGPGPVRAALPIVAGSTAVAALELAFPAEVSFTPAARRHLLAAADAMTSWWATAGSEHADVHAGAADRWLESVIDAALTPAAILSPMWTDHGELCDFRIDYTNAAAATSLGAVGATTGRRLLDVAPDLVEDGRFEAWVRAYSGDGEESSADRFRATRVGGRLVAMWHASAAAGEPGALQATSRRLATERMRSAVERAQTEQLRAAFFPPSWTNHRHGPLVVAARHVAPSGVHSFRGDFYEISPCGDELTVTVGDVFGSGVAAAQTMVRLRHNARALAFAGLGPADVLRLTNLDFAADDDPPMASLVLARIEPDGRTARWAQAGHFSPIMVRDGKARSLRRPAGGILGLTPHTRYTAATVQLEPGDLLVFFTDGVLHRWPGSPMRQLAAECERAHAGGGAEELLERVLPPQEDEACLVALHWPAADA